MRKIFREEVEHPEHYVNNAATVEPIQILRHAPFDIGNALKYALRLGDKGIGVIDLEKAKWYLRCAEETATVFPERYDEFFNTYGHLLLCFGKIGNVAWRPRVFTDGAPDNVRFVLRGRAAWFSYLRRVLDEQGKTMKAGKKPIK